MQAAKGVQPEFGAILGSSPALLQILSQAKAVASTDAPVLILGETGTGKELIARAIHSLSPRAQYSIIKLNCAAIPSGLLESELFGHEKGAFTGALSHKIGRLQLADRGTMFLDEIGDLPTELQPKLLRVLQDGDFERLGSTQTLHTDIRLIAATNVDLKAAVAQNEFRSDLFYRLSVFPLRMPPLRARPEDIPLLADYFVRKFGTALGKQITEISPQTIDAMLAWQWPGNVRELENFIERSVLLTRGSRLSAPINELDNPQRITGQTSLKDFDRAQIIQVLKKTRGVVAGPSGAAAILGLKRTTLQSQLRKLGIRRSDFK